MKVVRERQFANNIYDKVDGKNQTKQKKQSKKCMWCECEKHEQKIKTTQIAMKQRLMLWNG